MSIHVSHFNFHGRFSQLPNLTLACYLLFNQLVSKNELSKGIWLSIYPAIRRESNQWNARGEWARNFRGGVGGTHGRSLARVVKIGGFATQTAGRRAASSAAGLRVVARCPDVPGEISEIGWHLLQKANMFIVEFEEWVLINYCCFHLFSKMGNQKVDHLPVRFSEWRTAWHFPQWWLLQNRGVFRISMLLLICWCPSLQYSCVKGKRNDWKWDDLRKNDFFPKQPGFIPLREGFGW